MAEPVPLPPGRRVGLLLGAAIFFAPWAFAWFTLRKGYSDRAKQVAFGWAAVSLVLLVLAKHGGQTTVTPPMTAAAPSRERAAASGSNDAAKNAVTRILTTDLDRVPTALDEVDAAIRAKNWTVVKARLPYLADLFEPLRGVKIAVNGTDNKTGKPIPGVTALVEEMRDRYESYGSALRNFEQNNAKATSQRAAGRQIEEQPMQDDSNPEALARRLGFNEIAIQLATKIAARFLVPKMRAFDMAITAGQLCMESVPHSRDMSDNEMTVAIAQHALVFVERVTRTARERQMMPLADAFVTYRLSRCPM
jgi:hypothetical protein